MPRGRQFHGDAPNVSRTCRQGTSIRVYGPLVTAARRGRRPDQIRQFGRHRCGLARRGPGAFDMPPAPTAEPSGFKPSRVSDRERPLVNYFHSPSLDMPVNTIRVYPITAPTINTKKIDATRST